MEYDENTFPFWMGSNIQVLVYAANVEEACKLFALSFGESALRVSLDFMKSSLLEYYAR